MRLLSDEDFDRLAQLYPLLDISFQDDYREEFKVCLEAQAALTCKEVGEWILNHEPYDVGTLIEFLLKGEMP